MTPDDIISLSDLQKPRSISELDEWVHRVHDKFAQSEEGKNYVRQRRRYTKQLYEELWPLLRYAQARYGQEEDVELRPVVGSQPFDAIVKDSVSEYKVETTFAKDGHEEYHKMKLLESEGHVSVYGTLEISGSKNKGYCYKMDDRACSIDEIFGKYVGAIVEAYDAKMMRDYSDVEVLIVGFDDFMLFLDDEDPARFHTILVDSLSDKSRDFDRAWIVGMSGRFHVELVAN